MNITAESYVNFTAENCRKACAEMLPEHAEHPGTRKIMLAALAEAANSIERVLRFEAERAVCR